MHWSCIAILLCGSCVFPDASYETEKDAAAQKADSAQVMALDTLGKEDHIATDSLWQRNMQSINTKHVHPAEVVAFAETLMGTPYQYASTNPEVGFDCSGFITYVFNHFGIQVPRSSVDFTNVGQSISTSNAKPGDLILFTGTDSTEKTVGHMGIVVFNKNDTLQFIHSSSGKANGVTITPLNDYYKGRYVKTIRVFPQNG